jgi:hypothetical protein
VPQAWSRVLSVRDDADLEVITAYSLEVDLKPRNALDVRPSRRRIERPWQPYFWPEHYALEHKDHLTLAENQMTEAQLRQKAKAVTKARARMRKTALEVDAKDQVDPHITKAIDLDEEEAKVSKVA